MSRYIKSFLMNMVGDDECEVCGEKQNLVLHYLVVTQNFAPQGALVGTYSHCERDLCERCAREFPNADVHTNPISFEDENN